jgi:hypothetical protein
MTIENEKNRIEKERASAAENVRAEEERQANLRADAERAQAESAAEEQRLAAAARLETARRQHAARAEDLARLSAERAEIDRKLTENLARIAEQQASAVTEAATFASLQLSYPLTALATLTDVYEQRDRKVMLSIKPSKNKLVIGADDMQLSVTSSASGYLYLMTLGSDQKKFYLLFPNALDQENAITPQKPLPLPRPNWSVRANGPAGHDHILAIVTPRKLDLSKLNLSTTDKENPFAYQDSDLDGRRNLVDFIVAESIAGTSIGADLITIEEMR